MKRVYITAALAAVLVLLGFTLWASFGAKTSHSGVLKVGFIYENDESTPYTYNFALAEDVLRETYHEKIEIYSRSNVPYEDTEKPLSELIRKGCEIIFTNGYSEQFYSVAAEYPEVQFCQASFDEARNYKPLENYHTFKGEIYQGRYVNGIAAGMKLNEMMANHVIDRDEAVVGYVAAYPTPEVISGYTAFLLGVRSVCPEAVMRVRYIHSWGSFAQEKAAAEKLIGDGCRIISQHTDTIGPAIACEDAFLKLPVYHVGYNMSMIEVAPSCSIVSTCINWTPYITGAVEALLNGETIESHVEGNVNGNDMCAGFELGWVEMLELNTQTAAHGTQEKMKEAIEGLKKDRIKVFKGDYIGEDPVHKEDTIDLKQGYKENMDYSSPSFHYILKDVIIIDE